MRALKSNVYQARGQSSELQLELSTSNTYDLHRAVPPSCTLRDRQLLPCKLLLRIDGEGRVYNPLASKISGG